MITITKEMILNLIGLLDKHGLIHGAGETTKAFCIQQAVNRVIHDDLYGQYSDNPGWDCMNDHIRSFGIRMNDCSSNKMTNEDRAEALKRFAIAELGSNQIDASIFFLTLRQKLGLEGCYGNEDIVDDYVSYDCKNRFERLKKLADTAADILQEMGTEGSKFLHLLDEPSKSKQINKAYKLGDKMYADRMADFGCNTGCTVKPKLKQ